MTYEATTRMAEFHLDRPKERLGAFLRTIYGHGGDNRDKRLARDLASVGLDRMTDRAARNLFENHWPGDETWAAIVRRFGADVLRAVFAPEIAPVLAELTETEVRLERELERARAHKRALARVQEGMPDLLAAGAAQDRDLTRDLFDEARP